MLIRLNLKKVLHFLTAAVLTGLFFCLIAIASPQSEGFLNGLQFNLNRNDNQYWKKEFILQLEIKNQDLAFRNQKIAQTKDILYKRLNDFGVEEVTIRQEDGEDEANPILRVTVQSSKSEAEVVPLITQRYFMRIVTRKDGVDYDSEDDPYAVLNPNNYDQTPFTRRFFRNLYITKLPSTSGEESYFVIFKPYFLKSTEFNQFITEHAGQTAGLQIDGIVMPISIPVPTQTKPVFSVALNINDQQAKATDLLMNSGVIPVSYTVPGSTDQNPQVYDINYIQLTLSFIGAIIVTAIYFILRRDSSLITTMILPFTLLITAGLAYLKVTQTPVDLFILPLLALVIYIMAFIFAKQQDKSYRVAVLTVIFFALLYRLGIGYIRSFSFYMIFLTLGLLTASWLSGIYINALRKTTE